MMRSLTGGSAGLPDAFGQIGSRFGKSCSVRGEPLLAYLLGDCAPKAIAAKFGREKYHKRSENIGDNARGEGAVAWVDPTASPTEIQQKRTCLRIPAQSRKMLYNSGRMKLPLEIRSKLVPVGASGDRNSCF
jgi:hypothetical protein